MHLLLNIYASVACKSLFSGIFGRYSVFLLSPAGVTCATWVLFALIWPFTSLQIIWISFSPVCLSSLLLLMGYVYYFSIRPDAHISSLLAAVLQMILFTCAGALLNYLGLYAHRPSVDGVLAQMDAALGLDWLAYVQYVKANPFMSAALTFAYESSQMQMIVCLILLAYCGFWQRLQIFMFAYMIAALITIGVWVIFPNMGALQFHYVQGLPMPRVLMSTSLAEVQKLVSLMKGHIPPLYFNDMIGLIGCPSFHTVMALLVVYALYPIPYINVAFIILNIFVLISVPADGGHNFVDVLAGAFVSVMAWRVASYVLNQRQPTHKPPPIADACVPAPYQP